MSRAASKILLERFSKSEAKFSRIAFSSSERFCRRSERDDIFSSAADRRFSASILEERSATLSLRNSPTSLDSESVRTFSALRADDNSISLAECSDSDFLNFDRTTASSPAIAAAKTTHNDITINSIFIILRLPLQIFASSTRPRLTTTTPFRVCPPRLFRLRPMFAGGFRIASPKRPKALGRLFSKPPRIRPCLKGKSRPFFPFRQPRRFSPPSARVPRRRCRPWRIPLTRLRPP